MSGSRNKPLAPRLIGGALACLVVITAGVLLWKYRAILVPDGAEHAATSVHHTPDLKEPEEAYSTFLHVCHTGGCKITRPAAISWLDRVSREKTTLPENQTADLIDMLVEDGHDSWKPGYRQHLFNSACNALRIQPRADLHERLARILLTQATSHPDRILRLYALQHIDSLRKAGQLNGPLAGEIHASLETIASSQDSDISGTALLLLAGWDGPAGKAPLSVLELAAQTAADRSRPVDVRVSAIHTAGPTALAAARAIAVDSTEPVILRKAAIARIGEDGTADDLTTLKAMAAESLRLAQAAEPALAALQSRLENPSRSAPRPY